MKHKSLSTFEREMQNPELKEQFENEYREFVLSELLIALMEKDNVSVRKLAQAAGLSPSLIQRMRSGEQKDVKVRNFISIAKELGYQLILEKGKTRIPLGAKP
ncbi:MAG: helix-turn-helix domain-containing protein [Saprospiraceae bacterium]|nr:helix-turn-helix domain-containing protein [Saprospiraceae bacterium]